MQLHDSQAPDTDLVRAQPSAALARVADLLPHNFGELMQMAVMGFKSGLAKCETPEQAAMMILTGMELGLSPGQSMRGLYSVEGRVFIPSDTMVALILQSGLCEDWEVLETTDQVATITTKRRGKKAVERSFTAADAERAQLVKKNSGHEKYPRIMLLHRCVAVIGREVYPDVLLGMYVPEEQAEIIQAEIVRPRVVEAKESQPLPRAPSQNLPPEPSVPAGPARDWDAEIAAADSLEALKELGTAIKATKASRSAEEGTRLSGLFQARKKALTPVVEASVTAATPATTEAAGA
ncbi:MAG: hypothetical protein Q8S73_41210 [Deltaproteobacteria bacterium]|nr:hypothetical protein [Myxococcales bacterium]MDP3220580.1 hypothetical protein [Deltaproteobacteria bacterium]